jgi:hypothetical protein
MSRIVIGSASPYSEGAPASAGTTPELMGEQLNSSLFQKKRKIIRSSVQRFPHCVDGNKVWIRAPLLPTLPLFVSEKGVTHGSPGNQEMRAPGVYVSGHFGEVLQPSMRGDGGNRRRGLHLPSLGLQG